MFDIFTDVDSEFYEPRTVLLIDGSFLQFRSFFGYNVESFKRSDGTPSNCIYGVAKTLQRLISEEKPTHIAVAYDKGRAGHRQDMLPTYKHGRQETPKELIEQFPIVKQMLDLMNVYHYEQEFLEADDIIATYAAKAAENKWNVKIFSSDKDMHQLINDHISIIRPQHSGGGFVEVDHDYIVDKYGITPTQYPQVAALTGEGADNIPGVPKWGEKTAAKYILEYGDIENLLANADKIPGVVGANLRDNIDQVRLNLKINKLLTDADLPDSLDKLEVKIANKSALNEFFLEWEMKSLVGKF